MKGQRFTEEQIIRVLKEAVSGSKVTGLRRPHGISVATYSGGGPSEAAWRSQRPNR